ncbi:DNA cytosine methyltransferase [Helicobacter pylori]
MKVGSLFAGIGGFECAFLQAGFEIGWANELDKDACNTYRANFKHKLLEQDIKDLNPNELEDVGLISAGFPCQAFSIAGLQKGLNDERGAIVMEMFRIIQAKKPQVLLLENVKNLVSHNKGETLKFILETLKNLGYFVHYKILNTYEYSTIPQNRERIYIIGFLDKNHYKRFHFPLKINHTQSIKDLLEIKVGEEFYYKQYCFYETLKKEITKRDTCYQWRRHYVRENKNNLCPTLTANMGTGGHNVPLVLDEKGIRKLTPKECLNFQGFAKDYVLPNTAKSKLYKQIGNSVSVPVIKALALEIKKVVYG